jgi:undecaprenyl-diphosphatase
LVNLLTDRRLTTAPEKDKQITWRDGLLVGIAQAVAIFPGISRSGSTVGGGIARSMSRQQAFRFSFLLGIPAIAGAGVLQGLDLMETGLPGIELLPWVAGFIAAFVSGYLSIALFKYVISRARLELFGYYCLAVGLLVIFIL